MLQFNHFDFNVLSLGRSLDFCRSAWTSVPSAPRKALTAPSALLFLGDGSSSFTLELTEVKGQTEPYDLGECEFHLAFTAVVFDGLYQRHRDMGCICLKTAIWGCVVETGSVSMIVPQRR